MSKKLFTKSLSALLSAVLSVEFGVFNCPQEAFAIDTTSSYAVYSDGDIIVNTSRGVINGNVYTGDDFKYLGKNTCYVNKNLNADHISDNVQVLSKNESRAEKPDYGELLKKRVSYSDVRSGDTHLKGGSLELDGSMSVDGSLKIDRTVFSGKGYITAEGDIKYNAVQNTDDTEMFLTSNSGNITIQGTDLVMKGVIYAPEGKVEINAKHFIFNGTIIAEKVELNGTDVTINELSSDDNTLLQFGPELTVKGIEETYKENRKITLDISESFGIGDVDVNSLSWEFSPVSGNNYSAVKTDDSASTALHKELIISKAGDYQVIISGKDKSGEPFKYTDNLKVIEDIAPVADFTKEFEVTGRDGEGTASIKLTDNSYSLDGDEIGSRVWSVFFDSDNDGEFSDEAEDIFSTGNEKEVVYDAKSVGKYKFELHSAEVFTDTIKSLLSEDAYLVSDTSDRGKTDSVVEVTNEAPESRSGISLAKNVDIVITAGNADIDEINTLNNNVNEIKKELEEKGFSVNLDTISTSTLTAKDTFAWQEYDHYKYEDRYLPTLDKHIIYDEDSIKMLGYSWAPLRDWLFVDDGVSAKRVLSFDMVRDKSIEVNVEDRRDLNPPEITIDTKKDIVIKDGKVEVNGTVKDDVKLDTYTVELQGPDESELKTILTSSDEVNGGLIVSFDTNDKLGKYILKITAADTSGNKRYGKLDGNGNISASADSSMLNDGDYIVTIAVKVPDGTSVKKDITVKVKHDYVKAAEDVKCTIVSPDYNAEITAPSEIKAEVTENKFSRYKFEYSPAGKNDYTVFAKGAVAGKEITGKLDPTLMENGFYDIRVTAYGDKITAEDTITVELTGNMKIGNFTLNFADLEFEAQGIPVTMIRTYDSRNKDKNGEFGYGWDLSYNTVKLNINSDQSENWTEKTNSSNFVTQFEIMETKQHKIKIDLSNGVTDEFTMSLSPARQVLIPQHYDLSISYVSTRNSGATLVPCDMSPDGLFYDSGVLINSEFNYGHL